MSCGQASELTLPLLLGHPVLEDLEQVPSLPESSKDARNDAMAVLFAVRQHEKAEAGGAEGGEHRRLLTISLSRLSLLLANEPTIFSFMPLSLACWRCSGQPAAERGQRRGWRSHHAELRVVGAARDQAHP